MRTNFKFESQRQKDVIISFIRELKAKEHMLKKNMAQLVKKTFNISAHTRTIEGWIDETNLSEQSKEYNKYMDKCRLEYTSNRIKPKEETILEEMFSLAKARGLI